MWKYHQCHKCPDGSLLNDISMLKRWQNKLWGRKKVNEAGDTFFNFIVRNSVKAEAINTDPVFHLFTPASGSGFQKRAAFHNLQVVQIVSETQRGQTWEGRGGVWEGRGGVWVQAEDKTGWKINLLRADKIPR